MNQEPGLPFRKGKFNKGNGEKNILKVIFKHPSNL